MSESSLQWAKECCKNPVIILTFPSEPDLFLSFCADTVVNPETKTESLTGLTLWGVRKSRGPIPYALKENLVPAIFKPRLMQKSPTEYSLSLDPLQDVITLIKRPTHFTALFPFAEQKKSGQVQEITIEYAVRPLRMYFTVIASYKPSKDAEPIQLTKKVECPKEFTQRLYDFFMNDEKTAKEAREFHEQIQKRNH